MTTNTRRKSTLLIAACVAAAFSASVRGADPGKLTINVGQPGAKISPTLYGLMTEEINYSYDGGLYGELIQNRIFADIPVPRRRGGAAPAPTEPAVVGPAPMGSLAHWSGFNGSTIALDQTNPVNTTALKTSARVDISGPGGGIANDGFWGIPVKPNAEYTASFYARANGFTEPLKVAIIGDDGVNYANGQTEAVGPEWKQYKVTLKTTNAQPTAAAKFVISADRTVSAGSFFVNLVSLFPPTFHDRPNGFRPDIMQLLDEMHPTFLRFPGGNYLEGNNFANRFDWKATIGPYEERVGHNSPWNYRSSDGMGLLEFLEWCEDLKMEPVLAVFAAYTLDGVSTPAADYPKYAQEAVEEIEYVTGDVNTTWGARRAKDGHPAPFQLTYVEVGNEDKANGTYNQRFPIFYQAIKAKYPNIKVMATTRVNGPVQADVIDEHHYPNNMYASLALANSFDNRARTGQKVFIGEWATRMGNPTPNFTAAMCDAAFMCGVERNADLVDMFCYAPLFVNVNPGGMQWPTDMIGYNTLSSFGSPAYYVEKMFYNNKGDVVLPVALTPQIVPPALLPPPPNPGRGRGGPAPATGAATAPARPAAPPVVIPPMFSCASRDDATGDIILKVVNARDVAQQMEIDISGIATINPTATGEILSGTTEVNSIADPMKCAPKPITITDASAKFVHEFPGNSVSVIRFKTK